MSIHSRRDFLLKTGQGLSGAALAGLVPGLGSIGFARADELIDPLAPRQPQFQARVKSVIWLHMRAEDAARRSWWQRVGRACSIASRWIEDSCPSSRRTPE